MSGADIRIVTIVVPNPLFDTSKNAQVINSRLSYSLRVAQSFQTLSNTNPQNFDPIEGLLYVPQLSDDNDSVCADALDILPDNATDLGDFPTGQDYPLVAIFPWVSAACTQAFLAQTRADAVRGAFVFLPNASNLLNDPPSPTDPAWNLNDGDRWKSDNPYPVYAIAYGTGPEILSQMVLYSGNMSDAPNGNTLITQYNSRDFPRLFAHVDLQGGASVPSLWIFLIIVLAVLLGIVIIASIIMHFVQRHQRYVLQRRLERGEVDLETLGIKKMNVPQDKINEMPKYVYTETLDLPPAAASSKQTSHAAVQTQTASFSQSTCAICLDDFIPHETEVRELPCKHIYHPECIDLFLRDSSSLCPMCKKSALPPGYFPIKVTNMMVRRERIVRRMRERRRQAGLSAAERFVENTSMPSSRAARTTAWISHRLRRPAQTSRAPQLQRTTPTTGTTALTTSDVEALELGSTQTAATAPVTTPAPGWSARRMTMAVPPDVASQGAAARRTWRRERFARLQDEQYTQQAETTRQADLGRPLWRRVVGRVVPGVD